MEDVGEDRNTVGGGNETFEAGIGADGITVPALSQTLILDIRGAPVFAIELRNITCEFEVKFIASGTLARVGGITKLFG